MNLLAAIALLFQPAASVPRPNPGLAPEQVVKIVAEALGNNNSPIPNAGVFTAYQFASPANHAVTGPYGRFLQLVKLRDYAPMLRPDHPQEFLPIEVAGEHAGQTVRIHLDSGEIAGYRFSLSRQAEGSCRGCWMVDGVARVP